MITFREYLEEEEKKKSYHSTRAKQLKQEREKAKEQPAEDFEETPKEDIKDVDFSEFNMDEPHSVEGLMGKSFNGNVALLHKNRHSVEAKKIKEYFSSQFSPIKGNGELVFLTIQPEQVRKKGRNPIIINTIFPETSRTLAQEFFKSIKSHAEVDLFAGLYSILKNQGVFEKPVKKLLRFYLPDSLLENEEEKTQNLDKIRETLLKESIDTIHPRVKEEEDGSSVYLKYMEKDFSLFSYLVSYQILARTKRARLRQFTEEIWGIPSGEKGYSSPQTPPFFANRPKTNKDVIGLSTSGTDSKENVETAREAEEGKAGIEPNIKNIGDKIPEDDFEDEDEKEFEEKLKKEEEPEGFINLKKTLINKPYSGVSFEKFLDEYKELEDLNNLINNREILKSFTEGSPVYIKGDEVKIFKTSLKELDKELSEIKIDYGKKERKEDLRKIRDVKLAGSKLGKPYVLTKTGKGLEKLGRRTREDEELTEESILSRKQTDTRSLGEYIPREIKSIGSRKFSAIDDEMNAVKKDMKELIETKGKTLIKKDADVILERVKKTVLDSAENIIYYYSKEIQKYSKPLDKRVKRMKDAEFRIRGFDEPNYVSNLGYYANMIKGNIRSLISRLDILLNDYKEMNTLVINKVRREKEKIEKITSNPKDYGVLERKAYERYAEEKLERQKVESSSEILRKLKEIEEFVKERETEGFSEIKMFKDFKRNIKKSQEYYNRNFAERMIKKYDEIKFLSQKELTKRSNVVEGVVKRIGKLKAIENKEANEDHVNLIASYKEYISNPSNESYQNLVKTLSLTSGKYKHQEKIRTEKEKEAKTGEEVKFPTSDEEIADKTRPKESAEYTPEKAKKSIGFLKKRILGIKNLISKNKEKVEADRAKIAKGLADMRKASMESRRTTPVAPKPSDQEQIHASLYFKEEVNDLSQISASIFEPFKKTNDNIVILTNRASASKDINEIANSMDRVKRILISSNRPNVIIPSYTEKILYNINTIIDKIETLLDAEKAEPSVIINISKTIDMLITFLETTSSNFTDKVIGEMNKKETPQEEPEQKIPEGVKPAITTKKLEGYDKKENKDLEIEPPEENNEKEDEDENLEEKPKNLLALAKEKLKAGK